MAGEGVERFDIQGDDGDARGIPLSVLIGNLESLRDRFGDMPVAAGRPEDGEALHIGIYEDGAGRMMTMGSGHDMSYGVEHDGPGEPAMIATDWKGDDGDVRIG